MKLKGNDYDDIYNSYPVTLAFCWNMDWNETALKAEIEAKHENSNLS